MVDALTAKASAWGEIMLFYEHLNAATIELETDCDGGIKL
jgi:hypothetical protein